MPVDQKDTFKKKKKKFGKFAKEVKVKSVLLIPLLCLHTMALFVINTVKGIA